MTTPFSRRFRVPLVWFERALALAVIVGVVVFAAGSFRVMAALDWRDTETFYELIYRILLLVIGLELARTLVTHELMAVLELLAFVIARKMLKPDLEALDIVLGVAAFVALLAARRYLMKPFPPEGQEFTPGDR